MSEGPSTEQRIERLESQVRILAETAAALADDNLRLAAVLTEMGLAGALPPPPWRLAALLVELQHLVYAIAEGAEPDDGVPLAEKERNLRRHIEALREELRESLTPTSQNPGEK